MVKEGIHHSRRRTMMLLGATVGVLMAGLTAPAFAQSALEKIATYAEKDRSEMLLKGAQKEGSLAIYTSQRVEDMTPVANAFEKKYGIKTTVWRANSDQVLQRAVTEARAGRHQADVYETNGVELEALYREDLLQRVDSPVTAELLPQAIPAHKNWVGTRLNIITAAFNTEQVKKEEIPRTWKDFLDPKWKGKIGIEADDGDWFSQVVPAIGGGNEQDGLQFFRDLVAKNGVSVRKGHALMLELVAAGEIPLAMTVYQYQAEDLKAKGAPVDWFSVKPAIGRVNGVSVSRNAPHPHAAVLFFDFLLTDGQKIFADRHYTPTNTRVKPLPEGLEVQLIDPARMLDENAKWQNLFNEIIINRAAK
jgi:iron(III) transport system substrate-binding protein